MARERWVYPPGCLHTLTEEDRDSPEMNRLIAVVEHFEQLHQFKDFSNAAVVEFWKRPENRVYINNNLLRLIFHRMTEIATYSSSWQGQVHVDVRNALKFVAAIKFGSVRAFNEILRSQEETVDEDQARFLAVLDAIRNFFMPDLALLYLLDQMTPCNCLRQKIVQEERTLQREGNQDARFVCYVCRKREEQPLMHPRCSRCKMRIYCSQKCQAADWKHGADGRPHKEICPLIREIREFRVRPISSSR